jgi:hypothetical protein
MENITPETSNKNRFWENSGTRRAVVIAFAAAILIAVLFIYPDLHRFFKDRPRWWEFCAMLPVILGSVLGVLEWLHAGKQINIVKSRTNIDGKTFASMKK